jgi:hypothetical protein
VIKDNSGVLAQRKATDHVPVEITRGLLLMVAGAQELL